MGLMVPLVLMALNMDQGETQTIEKKPDKQSEKPSPKTIFVID